MPSNMRTWERYRDKTEHREPSAPLQVSSKQHQASLAKGNVVTAVVHRKREMGGERRGWGETEGRRE